MAGNNQPRSFKFYRKNEEEVMKSLGLKPTKNSGSGWIEKEDGQNDFVICQLKSTDAQSIRIAQKDIRILEYNASTTHKLPVFAIQFLNTGEVWLMAKPEDFSEVANYIQTGKCEKTSLDDFFEVDLSSYEESKTVKRREIKSSNGARDSFHAQREKKFKKGKSAL